MISENFRTTLSQSLKSAGKRVLLRVQPSGRKNDYAELTGPQLLARSVELATRFCDAPKFSVVLLLLPHSLELFLIHLGLVLSERLPAILAWPTNRVDPQKYLENVTHQLRSLPAAQLLTLPRLAKSLDPALPYGVTEIAVQDSERYGKHFAIELALPRVEKRMVLSPAPDTPEDALFLQFSGGTTGAQKCVVVTAPMLLSQLRRLSKALDFDSTDGVVSWLPMYHDMGLIACFWLPLWNLAPSTQFSATDWLMDPGMLFRLISEFRATFCWLPNFAFSYLAAQKDRVGNSANLAHVRAWINCSEPVRQRSFRAFTEAFAGLGVRPDQCHASYAMAENVFAVTQTKLGAIPSTVSRMSIDSGSSAPEVSSGELDDVYVSSGNTLGATAVRIRSSGGNLGSHGDVGEIEIHSESLFGGYWGNDGFRTHAFTADDWYATGDCGFMESDDLYVLARIDDVIIVAGQNVFPEDVEVLTNAIEGIYPGRVVAFGVEDGSRGTADLAVVAEMRGDFNSERARKLEHEIRRTVLSAFGIAPRDVRVVPERWIVKSTAGKLSRRETRYRFLEGRADSAVAGSRR
jgi:acyl-CoA synthetase (AMP-forming)/AMP-acid ligase II